MTKPAAILFDLGNVLVSIHPERFLRTLGIDLKTGAAMYQESIIDIVRVYERGQSTTEEFLASLAGLFEHRFTPEILRSAMLSVIGDPIPGMDSIVRRSTRQLRSALVSNTNSLHFEHCLTLVPSLQLLPHRFLSYQLRALKPESSYYEQILTNLDVDPSEILFVDDTSENVQAALGAGMRGVLFRNPEHLERDLTKLHVF